MRELVIGGRRIADDEPAYVIAEVGHNHGGSLGTAITMIKEAAKCGASAVKLQKRSNQDIYTQALLNQPYENENSFGKTYGEHRAALEFNLADYVTCRAMAKACQIQFFATAFDEASADFLMEVDVPAFKIASGDLGNTPLLQHVARLGKPMIISTGGGDWHDIERAVNAVANITPDFALLHCTAAYPVHDYAELNLLAIAELRARYPEIVIGWSGHDAGIAMPLMAYTLGARIIEKHFTLNRTLKGTDHAFSLEPVGLRKLVRDLGRAQLALGDGHKRPFPSEAAPLKKMAKSLVAARDLPAGHVLTAEDIARKSPAGGIPPHRLDCIIGAQITKPVAKDDLLNGYNLNEMRRPDTR